MMEPAMEVLYFHSDIGTVFSSFKGREKKEKEKVLKFL
jgi:hypothetical protein